MTATHDIVLTLIEPGRDARLIVVSGTQEVGRSAPDIALNDPEASRVHARFRVTDDGLEVTDLWSRNGTFVNGQRIAEPTLVVPGGWIDLGACRFVLDGEAGQSPSPPPTTEVRPHDDLAVASAASASRTDDHAVPTASTAPSPSASPAAPRAAGQERRASRRARRGGDLGPFIAVAIGFVVVLVLRLVALQVFSIPSESMEPTLLIGDRVLAVTWGARGSVPGYGEVIIFDSPVYETEGGEQFLVKRVIGRPGDQLVIIDGAVVRNGQRVDEPWLTPGTVTANLGHDHDCTTEAPCVVPAGAVWALGDNRTRSEDSRWFGVVSVDAIVGHAVARVWQPSRIGGV